jgi:hypothetical protein
MIEVTAISVRSSIQAHDPEGVGLRCDRKAESIAERDSQGVDHGDPIAFGAAFLSP